MTIPSCLRPSRGRAWTLIALALVGCEADTASAPKVIGVSVLPDSVVLHALGETVDLEARVDGPADAVGGLAWRTSAPDVATVSSSGVVTAVGPGVAVVTAEVDGTAGTASVRVEQAPAAVRLTTAAIELDAIGATHALAATVVDAGGHAVPGARARWSSSDTAVVRVDSTGVATAVASGIAQIRAEVGSASATAEIVVRPVVATVTLVAPPSSINVGDELPLVARAADRNGNALVGATFTWSSSNLGALTVDAAGHAHGVSLGRARVTVRAGGAQASADIDVVQTVTAVDAETPAPLASLGDSVPLRAVARDASGGTVAGAGVGWTSLDPGTASILPGGFARAVANGTARVVAASGPARDTVSVRVEQKVTRVAITPGLVILPAVGATAQLTATAYDARGNVVTGRATTWSSSFPPTVGVSSQGLVTAGSNGGAYVTASVDGVEATVVVRTGYKVGSVTVSPDSLVFRTVQVSAQLVGVVRDSAGNAIPIDLEWSTSDADVAYLTGPGRVYARSPGTAIVTASVDTFRVRIPVRVAPTVASVDLMNDTIVLHRPGIRTQIYYLVSDTAGRALRPFQLEWTSRDPAVFSVDSEGWITTVGPGRAWVVGSYGMFRDSTLIHEIPYSQLRLDLEFDSSRVARVRTSYRDTLVATVRDLAGNPVQGVHVYFTTSLGKTVTFSPITGSRYYGTGGGRLFEVWTDKDGHAPTRVVPRDLAGDWRVSASIDVDSTALLLADTMTFTVVHGPPARLSLSGPSAITVGQSGQVTGTTATDPYGNRFPATPTFSTSSPYLSVTPSGTVTALGVGLGYVRGEYSADGATARDSVAVYAVPSASLMWEQNKEIRLGDLTGQGVALTAGEGPSWSASYDRIVYVSDGQIRIRDFAGNVTTVPTPGVPHPRRPFLSRDGQWIYFEVEEQTEIRRVRLDGSGQELLQIGAGASVDPAISPDGGSLAYVTGQGLYLLDLATRGRTQLAIGSQWATPRWSPDGRWIAAMTLDEGVTVMRPDGSERSSIPGSSGGHDGLTWSPDGQWILHFTGSRAVLVDPVAREVYRIPWSATAYMPNWKP